ncbi:hypothetical protein [Helicobacter turcicus]|uniref:Uncharacterized protein n=1 Tax=Helicobacter turcicus TaxID=2867412 RepID=A0ABS7JPB4_9HELI|nr:hypothetical protein [Helicobacter turcicus]MBX7491253.1 hypothetical protein [Helicobacter turcicus]MBX7546108.1 hypothetical protein [Helicobacter turcicus]
MTLAKILHFSKEECKMKIDRLKEEVANIRRTQNILMAASIGVTSYLFTTFQAEPKANFILYLFGRFNIYDVCMGSKNGFKVKRT